MSTACPSRSAWGSPGPTSPQAREKAEQVAAATGHQLGEVVSVREVRATAPRDLGRFDGLDLRGEAYAAKELANLPIRAGEEELGVAVQVVWSFA